MAGSGGSPCVYIQWLPSCPSHPACTKPSLYQRTRRAKRGRPTTSGPSVSSALHDVGWVLITGKNTPIANIPGFVQSPSPARKSWVTNRSWGLRSASHLDEQDIAARLQSIRQKGCLLHGSSRRIPAPRCTLGL